MAKRYNITGVPINLESWEQEFRKRWTEEAQAKNDHIVGDGYAERQKADTLSKVKPINLHIPQIGKNMDALIKRGDAVEKLAGYFPECERNEWREKFAAILNQVPSVKRERGSWIRDADTDKRAPGLHRYFCSHCSTYNDTRSPYCPNCGAYMRSKR